MWKYLPETKDLVKELDKEIYKAEREVLDFGGLITSPLLEREYSRAIGYIAGLNQAKTLIEETKDDDKLTDSISR